VDRSETSEGNKPFVGLEKSAMQDLVRQLTNIQPTAATCILAQFTEHLSTQPPYLKKLITCTVAK
jgi:hypothetical protein